MVSFSCTVLWIRVLCIVSAGLYWIYYKLPILLVTLAEMLLNQCPLWFWKVHIFSGPAFLKVILIGYFWLLAIYCPLVSVLVDFVFFCQTISSWFLLLFPLTSLLFSSSFVVLSAKFPVLVIFFYCQVPFLWMSFKVKFK